MPDPAASPPPEFRRAVTSLGAFTPRPELVVSALDAPPRLAPWTWAMEVEVADSVLGRIPDDEADEADTSGRLILLHDPAGRDAWDGTFRLVCFVQARLEPEQLGDELLPVVGWSWLTESLDAHGAAFGALGGTVTQTSSMRFGDLARRPGTPRRAAGSSTTQRRDDDVELRASWTPLVHPDEPVDLTAHAVAFCDFVASAAGLPPVGAVPLAHRTV